MGEDGRGGAGKEHDAALRASLAEKVQELAAEAGPLTNTILQSRGKQNKMGGRRTLSTAAPRCGASSAGSASSPGSFAIEEPTAYELKVSHHSLANLAAFCIIASADLYHLGLSCLPVHLCARS